jgi:transcriptional regulator with XRE-family HTH domain
VVDVVEGERVRALGRRLREMRLDRGLTLAQVAEPLGVGAPAICNFEKKGVDRISTLEGLAWALDAELIVELRPRKVA